MPKRSARGSDRSCSRIRARTVLLDFSTSRGDSLVTDCRAACFFPQLHSHVFSISRISDSFRTIPACPQGVMGLPSAHRSDIRRPVMKCPRCQHENPADSRFCFECGSRLALACGSCGAELPAVVKFCNRCGQAVGPPAAGSRSGSPESYTPKHLAEKILTSKAALEGERKQVTVLFADLKGTRLGWSTARRARPGTAWKPTRWRTTNTE